MEAWENSENFEYLTLETLLCKILRNPYNQNMLPPFPYQILLDWYSQNGRHDLPWRKDRSAYRVWLSEILLQQTQAPRVVPFFERIIKRYPTIEALSETTFEEFFPYYDGL